MRCLLAVIAVSLAGCVTAPPNEPSVNLSQRATLDVFEAAIRSRLAEVPLRPNSRCYLFLNEGALHKLSSRFPDYHVLIRSGSPGPSPPADRWYYLHLGRTSVDHAFVLVEDADNGLILELRRFGSRWEVIDKRVAILT
jgi:hypothetical protein